jgi:hypothetical protein
MRTPGPVDPSVRLVNASADRGAGPVAGLKAGSFVFVEVRERMGGELYRVAVGGRLFVASSASPLETGSLLKARVERASEGLVLRLLPREADERAVAEKAIANKATLPRGSLPIDLRPGDSSATAAALAAATALLREGVAPEARALSRVRRAALRDADQGGEAVDLAARMEAKGIPAEEDALGALLDLMGGPGGSGGGASEERDRRERAPGGEPNEDPSLEGSVEPWTSIDLERDFRVEVPEEEFPRRLAALLRAMSMRVGEGSDALFLFNHARGPEGHWLLVPFSFEADSVAFKGGLRIQLPYVRGGPGRIEAAFEVSRGSLTEDWSFFASFGGGRPPSLRIQAPRGSVVGTLARSRLDSLARSLAPFACAVSFSERDGERTASGAEGGGLDLDA